MNLQLYLGATKGPTSRCRSGMTMPEVMVTSAIFTLAMAGFLSLNLFAMRMNEMTKAKLGASDDARKSLSSLISEVRMAGLVRVGNGDEASFIESPAGEAQQGNALQIHPVKGNTNYIRYFVDDVDSQLKRTSSGGGDILVIANSLTNRLAFTSEDYAGQVLYNNFNNRVIGVTLQFYQLEFPYMAIGPGHQYDFYQLRTKITRRARE